MDAVWEVSHKLVRNGAFLLELSLMAPCVQSATHFYTKTPLQFDNFHDSFWYLSLGTRDEHPKPGAQRPGTFVTIIQCPGHPNCNHPRISSVQTVKHMAELGADEDVLFRDIKHLLGSNLAGG